MLLFGTSKGTHLSSL